MRLALAAAFVALIAASACSCGPGPKKEVCAASTEPDYREELATTSWPLYCPVYLPRGTTIDHIDFGEGLSTALFSLIAGGTLRIIQGHQLISPRTATGFAQPERDVQFGDVPAQLFMTSDGPMIRSLASEDVTRAILAPTSVGPDVVVRIAESMRRVD